MKIEIDVVKLLARLALIILLLYGVLQTLIVSMFFDRASGLALSMLAFVLSLAYIGLIVAWAWEKIEKD